VKLKFFKEAAQAELLLLDWIMQGNKIDGCTVKGFKGIVLRDLPGT
jgi:hypothetical protein